MAIRPAWTIENNKVICRNFEFQWNNGFSISQKRKNIINLHKAILESRDESTLEVSTKSEIELGKRLSAFSLKLEGYAIENIFQSSKVYSNRGPFFDLLQVEPKMAKRDERHLTSGALIGFVYKNERWDLNPKTAFYDYIYILSVLNSFSRGELKEIIEFDWFTDIEFNPRKSINCQARSAAILKHLLINDESVKLLNKTSWIVYHKAILKD